MMLWFAVWMASLCQAGTPDLSLEVQPVIIVQNPLPYPVWVTGWWWNYMDAPVLLQPGETYTWSYSQPEQVHLFRATTTAPASRPCRADLDEDGDVDVADMLIFQGCFNGTNRPPRCP